MPSAEALGGGCFCGAVRFELAGVYDAGYCHCTICRRMSGAPAVAWANVFGRDFRIVAGRPRGFASSPAWTRYFCGICGAPVHQRHPDPPRDGGDLVCVLIPSLDEPDTVRPRAHIWCSARLPYFEIDDTLPRFEQGELTPPESRGSPRKPA